MVAFGHQNALLPGKGVISRVLVIVNMVNYGNINVFGSDLRLLVI